MSRSNAVDYYFQTSDNLATTQRKQAKSKNKHGKPISLSSKILAIEHDPRENDIVYVVEAAGTVRKFEIGHDATKRTVLSGATAPLTCLAISPSRTLYAGCWDKSVYYTTLAMPINRGSFRAHADFVKCLLAPHYKLSGQEVLLSGGSDSSIVLWSVGNGQNRKLHSLKTTKALQHFAIDPLSISGAYTGSVDSFVLFTATSDREIRRWHIGLDAAHELAESVEAPIMAHETSVYKLRFDSEGDLWTASADKTAKHLVRSRDWEADTTLPHPDFVRDVVISEKRGLVITACRDEEVRVWGIASGSLVCSYSGHYEEVTGLALLGDWIVSVSIDATVRQWSLDKGDMAKFGEELAEEANGAEKDEEKKGGVLTAEEEEQLAELMDDPD